MPKEKTLPNLPYGQGSFFWDNEEHTRIRFLRNYKCKVDGKKYRLTVVGESVQDCYDKMEQREKIVEQEKGKAYRNSIENPNVTLANALYGWLQGTKSATTKAASYDRVECVIRNQVEGYDIALWRVVDITEKDLNKHLKHLQYEKDYSFSTVKKTYDVFNQFFKDFYYKNPVDNPMRNVQKPERKKVVGEITIEDSSHEIELKDIVFSDEEIKIFKNACYNPQRVGSAGSTKYGVALYFVMLTFLRIGEASALTWGDVDFENKVLKITKSVSRVRNRDENAETKTKIILTTPKTEKSIRKVMLTDEAIEALEHIKSHSNFTSPSDFVICTNTGNKVLEQNLFVNLKGILKASGLGANGRLEKFGLHYLRHTGISYYLRHGIPVDVISKMAGHASTTITMQTYYHIINTQNEEALKKMNNIKI